MARIALDAASCNPSFVGLRLETGPVSDQDALLYLLNAISEALETRAALERLLLYLFDGLEHVAAEEVARGVAGDVTENLEVLRVVRHVKYPACETIPDDNLNKASAARSASPLHHSSRTGARESRPFNWVIGHRNRRQRKIKASRPNDASAAITVRHEASFGVDRNGRKSEKSRKRKRSESHSNEHKRSTLPSAGNENPQSIESRAG